MCVEEEEEEEEEEEQQQQQQQQQEEEEEEEKKKKRETEMKMDLFVFNDTIEVPRAPAVKPGRVTHLTHSLTHLTQA